MFSKHSLILILTCCGFFELLLVSGGPAPAPLPVAVPSVSPHPEVIVIVLAASWSVPSEASSSVTSASTPSVFSVTTWNYVINFPIQKEISNAKLETL